MNDCRWRELHLQEPHKDLFVERIKGDSRRYEGVFRGIGLAACICSLAIDLGTSWQFMMVSAAGIASVLDGDFRKIRFHEFHAGLFLFYLSHILSSILAYDIHTALPQVILRTSFVLLYLILRSTAVSIPGTIAAVSLGMAIHCIEGLVAFGGHYRVWRDLQWESLVDFRSWVVLTLHGEKP